MHTECRNTRVRVHASLGFACIDAEMRCVYAQLLTSSILSPVHASSLPSGDIHLRGICTQCRSGQLCMPSARLEMNLFCMKDACRTRDQSQARLQDHSFIFRNGHVFSPAEGELLSSVPPVRHLSVGKRRGGGTWSCWLAGGTRVDSAGCSTC